MNRSSAALVVFVLLISGQLFAKGKTTKIVIEGPGLKTDVEITDPNVLKDFMVWAGPGTAVNEIPSSEANAFIINWARGPVVERPQGLQRYQVSFYAKLPEERMIHVVFWEYDPATRHGYVYLPGKGEQWYALNVSTILRGVEGKWFHAWKEWDKVAGPLIETPKLAPSR
jgi:hypothetical protein